VGIEAQVVKQKTGWDIIWEPVYAEDIPLFIKKNLKKTPQMRMVKFPLMQRIEVAIMWAFPLSVIVSLFTLLFWRHQSERTLHSDFTFVRLARPFTFWAFY